MKDGRTESLSMLTLPISLQQLEAAVPAQPAQCLAACCLFWGIPFVEGCPRHAPCRQGAKELSIARGQGNFSTVSSSFPTNTILISGSLVL